LRRAANIFAAPSETEMRDQLAAAKVTHLVIPSWDSLSSGKAFAELLRKAGSIQATGQSEPYFDQVVHRKVCPVWLRPFHYPIPDAFGFQGECVRVFEVRLDQTPFESYLFQGIYHLDAGAPSAAVEMFRKALEIKPGDPVASQALTRASTLAARKEKSE
jgi:hypothetical protein